MNFFHRIFAKEKNSARANNGPFFEQLEFRKSDWLDVFSVCLGKMYVIQSAVGKTVIGDSDWEVDFEHRSGGSDPADRPGLGVVPIDCGDVRP